MADNKKYACGYKNSETGEIFYFKDDEARTQCKDIANQKVVYNVLDYNISTENEDNTPALQTLVDTVNANGGGIIFFPVGTYNFKKASTKYAILAKSNVSIIGENIEKTILKCTEVNPYSLFYYMGTVTTPITGCIYKNFTVDCYNTGNTNKVYGKAFFYQYVKNCVFRDIILQGTIATALGIDFLDNVEIDNVNCVDCGRTFESESATSGTSGIGIGTGGWNNENFKITNCVTVGCGQYGIFIENQHTLGWGGNTDNPKGCIISNCITRNGLYRGIGIRGGTNVIVSNCNSYENAKDGIYLDNKCVNVKVSNNNVVGNRANGILSKVNSDSVDIDINDNFIKGNTNYGIKLSTNTNGLMLRHNITKGNTQGGLHSDDGLTHANTVARDNIFIDGDDTTNDLFTGITTYNDLLKDENATITAISCSDFTVIVDKTKTVSYSVKPSYADKSKVAISTTDTDYITVDNDAKTITGVAEGTATLTLTTDGVTTTVTVTVKTASATTDRITINNSDFTTGYKLDSTGELVESLNSGVSDFIDISNLGTDSANIIFSSIVLGEGGRIITYNSSKDILNIFTIYSLNNNETQENYSYIADILNAKYIKISINNLNDTSCEIQASNIIVINNSDFITGYKLMPDGSVSEEASSGITDYIYVTNYSALQISFYNIAGGIRVAQYDSNKNALSDNFELSTTNPATINMLNTACYIRIMISNIKTSTYVNLNPILK